MPAVRGADRNGSAARPAGNRVRFCRLRRTDTAMRMRVTVILPSGEVLGDSDEDPRYMENHADRPEVQQASAVGLGRVTRFSTTVREEMMYVAVPVFEERAVAA